MDINSNVAETQKPLPLEEQKRRRDAVDFARASMGLSGFNLSAEDDERAAKYIVGEITIEEEIALLKAQHAMQKIIDDRIYNIRQAHANNLISGLDIGETELNAMIERAKQPISNEELARQEMAMWHREHSVVQHEGHLGFEEPVDSLSLQEQEETQRKLRFIRAKMAEAEAAKVQPVLTEKQQDKSPGHEWANDLGERMVAHFNRMDVDVEYRKYIQSISPR